jgi:hypothetical protein
MSKRIIDGKPYESVKEYRNKSDAEHYAEWIRQGSNFSYRVLQNSFGEWVVYKGYHKLGQY